MKSTLSMLALTIATAAAHPGHPGHEDWPFDDFSWSMIAAAIGTLIIMGFIRTKLKKAE
jgi:hypothetical protein